MSIEVDPDTGAKLAALSKALREAGEKDLDRELLRAQQAAVSQVIPAVQESARGRLPARGGLNERVATSPMRVARRLGGANPGVRLIARSKDNIRRIDVAGVVRHPVFADSDRPREAWAWVDQQVPPGYFREPTEAARPDIQRASEQALDEVARRIEVEVDRA